MKKIVSIVLFFVLSCPFVLKTGVVLHYLANMQYYATTLCVNQDKPALQCDGKCQLSRELGAVEEMPAKSSSLPVSMRFEVSCFEVYTIAALPPLAEAEVVLPCFTGNFPTTSFFSDIFHPPQFFLNV